MADEPVDTSPSYSPCLPYMAPLGRLPVLGKIRAEIDKLRTSAADDINQIKNRNAAQANDDARAAAEVQAVEDKTEAEVALLNQKTVTELTQTSDHIPLGIGHNIDTTVQGVINKQKNLYQKQADGFDRDAEQKLAKIYADTWSVRQTTEGALAGEAGLGEADIRAILDNARAGINMNPAHVDLVPDPFTFAPLVGQAQDTEVQSAPVVLAGILDDTPISIVGGLYSINGSDFTSDPGLVTLGDSIVIQVTTASTPATDVVATVTIGEMTRDFTATTA